MSTFMTNTISMTMLKLYRRVPATPIYTSMSRSPIPIHITPMHTIGISIRRQSRRVQAALNSARTILSSPPSNGLL